ncbi:monocarboxylate transporter 12 [Topomyia yanbarensis]|uniref:monocarboxylate transporter 12 n=1 Tax=Topomyia yanbarensis TaxID=2498891 RepID=UPI00273CC692|nr:monocarboxylate transporter 12 [Topomyia yanbarensis]XP_058834628.1 monocarboxylate transporter 12 [Topomyia yanbarensis]XP_058834634.1 monocarboxylate transporter 12 [Topomyia yanbarensis]XP_058834642.1 monocarboxylate transporter 12 [Topomyia yanbarensis]XP_058834650.1 monocarboxylate transporter 12 [Topomyia yanbarensis]
MTHGPPARKRPQNGSTAAAADAEGNQDRLESSLPPPPDGGWGWMVVLASFCIHIVTDGITYSFGIFYVEFLDYFKEGKGYTAWIASILVGVTLCSGPVSSSLVNRYGCRAVTIAGSILASICLAVSIYAKNVFTLFITIGAGTGLGLGLIYLPAIVSVTMYFERLRSLATGIAVCGSGLGTFIFAPVTEILIAKLGWQNALLVLSVIVLGTSIFGAMFRPLKAVEPPAVEAPRAEAPHSKAASSVKLNNAVEEEAHNLGRSHSIGHSPRIALSSNGQSKSGSSLHRKHSEDETAQSQPLVSQPSTYDQVTIKRAESGTMYRKDALYTGSIHNIASRHASSASLAMYSKGTYGSVQGGSKPLGTDEKFVCCGCIPCSKETADTYKEMMSFSILRDPIFIIFTVSNFLTSVGFNVPYVYLAAQANVLNIDTKQASYLLGVIGIANTVGRIVLGYLSDKPWVNRLLVYNLCLTICGLATAFSVMCLDFYSLATYSAVFGFTIGAYVGLTSVILVDLLGLDKLTNAFGLLLLFQGIASFLGPPLAGWLYDLTLSYNPGFILAGTTIALSGFILFSIPPLQRYLARKRATEAITKAAAATTAGYGDIPLQDR